VKTSDERAAEIVAGLPPLNESRAARIRTLGLSLSPPGPRDGDAARLEGRAASRTTKKAAISNGQTSGEVA
jgi:hypothetical protein